MLLEFYVENFRSISRGQQVSLVANNAIRDLPKEGDSEYGIHKISNVLKSVNVMAFYGYNSSGKSNFFMAMNRMINMVVGSVRLNEGEYLPYEPFAFEEGWDNKPTTFKSLFIKEDKTYEYSFSYNKTSIVSEQLFVKIPGCSRKKCFDRNGSEVSTDGMYGREFSLEKINSNRLLISLVGQLGGVTANEVMGWFRSDFDAMSSSLDDSFGSYTKHALVENDAMAIEIKDFIRKFQLGFNDLSARKIDFDQLQFPAGIPAEILAQIKSKPIIELNTRHAVYDENGIVKYEKLVPLDDYESEGTIKLVHMSGVLARALYYGTTIAIDEFDARIHPTICQRIVDIFNSSETNPRGAQLLVTTHDTNLLSNKIFRRDQICFVKQNECASTIVYSLLDIMMPNGQAPRSDSNYERNYLLGAYDKIPTKYSANRDGI